MGQSAQRSRPWCHYTPKLLPDKRTGLLVLCDFRSPVPLSDRLYAGAGLFSVSLAYKTTPRQRRLVVVLSLVGAPGKFHFFPVHVLAGNHLEKMGDAVQ